MTFHIYADTGEKGGPFGSMPLAQKHARALIIGNKRCKAVELRPSLSSTKGGFASSNRFSVYKYRRDLLPE